MVEQSLSKTTARGDYVTLLTEYLRVVVTEAVNRSLTQAQELRVLEVREKYSEDLNNGLCEPMSEEEIGAMIQEACESVQLDDFHLDAILQRLLYDFT